MLTNDIHSMDADRGAGGTGAIRLGIHSAASALGALARRH